MNHRHLQIIEGTAEQAFTVAQQIEEFENLYRLSVFEDRLNLADHLILIATYKDKPIGFKIGYETPSKKHFYSWMGGVVRKYRKAGIAQLLLEQQENWVKEHNYISILVKTRNKHVGMMNLLNKNNYIEMAKILHEPDEETRLLYEKKLI